MNYKITIDDQTYSVKIEDLHARPVIVFVDGERFEVTPDVSSALPAPKPAAAARPAAPRPAPAAGSPPAKITPAPVSTALSGAVVKAPIPGVIVEIHVKPGDAVSPGQELVTLEAMKMKNLIRATRAGVVAEVLVSAGQTVNHNAALITFADEAERPENGFLRVTA